MRKIEDGSNGASPVKAGLYYLVCTVVIKGFGFLSTPIFIRLMDKEAYGIFANFLAIEGLVYIFATLNLRVTITKSKYDFEDNNTYLSSVLLLSSFITLISYSIVEISKEYFIELFSLDIVSIRFLFLYVFFYSAFEFQQLQDRVFNRYKRFVVYSIFMTIFRMIVSIIFVVVFKNKYMGRLIGYVIPSVILFAYIYCMIYINGKKIKLDYIKWGLFMAIPLFPSALSSVILNSSDQIVITKYCGAEQTALYAVGYTVSGLSSVFWLAMSNAWAPWLYDNINMGRFNEVRRVAGYYQLVYFVIVLGLMFMAPEIVLVLGGREYYSARWMMPPVIISMVFLYYYSFFCDLAYYYGEKLSISIGTLVSASVNLGLNFIFVPKYGYIAAAYTTLASYICLFFYHWCNISLRLKKNIYNVKVFIFYIILAIVFQLGIMFIYDTHYIVRYFFASILFFLFVFGVLKNRKVIVNALKR